MEHFTLKEMKNVCGEIYKLFQTIEDTNGYSNEDAEDCEKLYDYMKSSAMEKSILHNTEGCEELYSMIENGLDDKEIDYIKIYEEAVYEAYKRIQSDDMGKFRYYCYYREIKSEIEMIEEEFGIK